MPPTSLRSGESLWRWLGFVAGVALAASSWGSGSRPTRHTAILWPGWRSWVETGGSPAAATVSVAAMVLMLVAWWQLRSASVTTRWWWSTTALWFGPLVAAVPLYSRDLYSYAAQGALWAQGLSPYDHAVRELANPQWQAATAPTWIDSPTPYGPVWLIIARGAAGIADATGGQLWVAIAMLRIVAVVAVLIIAWLVRDVAERLGTDPRRATWLAVACPLVGAHLVGGAHNDAVMIAAMLGSVAVALRGRLVLAVLVLSVGALVKLTALVVAPFLVLLALHASGAPRRWSTIIVKGVVAALTAVAAMSAVSLASGLGFGWLAAVDTAGANRVWYSLPTALGQVVGAIPLLLRDPALEDQVIDVARLVGYGILAVTLVLLWLRAAHESHARRIVAHLGWAVGALVVLAPGVLAWYHLWAYPFLAVAITEGWTGPDGKERLRETWVGGIGTALTLLTLPDGYTVALRLTWLGAPLMLVAAVLGGRVIARRLRATNWAGVLDLARPWDRDGPRPAPRQARMP